MERIIKKLITLAIVIVPWLIFPTLHYAMASTKIIGFCFLAQIVFCLWLVIGRFRLSLIKIAVLLFLFLSTVSSLLGPEPHYSFWSDPGRGDGMIFMLHVGALFWVIASLLNKEEKKDLMKASIVSAGGIAFLSLMSHFFFIYYTAGHSVTVGNTSFMSTYLLINFFLAIYLFLSLEYRPERITSAVIMALIILASGLAGSKAAFGSMLIGFFIIFGYIILPNHLWRRRVLIGIIALAIISFLLIFWPGSPLQKIFLSFDSGSRLIVWRIGWEGFLDRPWFGWGRGAFSIPYFNHFNPAAFTAEHGHGVEMFFDRAHNVVVEKLVSVGIFGLISYLFLLFSVGYLAWKRKEKYFGLVFSTLLFAHFLQNLTVFDTQTSYPLLFAIFAFVDDSATESASRKKWWWLILWPFLFFYLTYQPAELLSSLRGHISEDKAEKIINHSLMAGDYARYHLIDRVAAKETVDFKYLLKYFPQTEEEDQLRIIKSSCLKGNTIMIDAMTNQRNRKKLAQAISLIEKYQNPGIFNDYLNRAQLYVNMSRLDPSYYDKAEEVINQGHQRFPNYLGFHRLFVSLYSIQKRYDDCIEWARQAISIEPRFGEPYAWIIKIGMLTDDDELVRKTYEEASLVKEEWGEFLKEELADVLN